MLTSSTTSRERSSTCRGGGSRDRRGGVETPAASGHPGAPYARPPARAHLLADAVLVDGPDGGHVGGQKLVLGEGGVTGAGADQARLAHRVVAHHHALDRLDVGPLVVQVQVHGGSPGGGAASAAGVAHPTRGRRPDPSRRGCPFTAPGAKGRARPPGSGRLGGPPSHPRCRCSPSTDGTGRGTARARPRPQLRPRPPPPRFDQCAAGTAHPGRTKETAGSRRAAPTATLQPPPRPARPAPGFPGARGHSACARARACSQLLRSDEEEEAP